MTFSRLFRCALTLALCAFNRADAQEAVTTKPLFAEVSHPAMEGLVRPTPDPRLIPASAEPLFRTSPTQALIIPGTRHEHIVVGAIVGAAVGVAFAFVVQPRCQADSIDRGPECDSYKLPAVLLLGTGGGVIGGLVGAALPHDP